MRKPHAALLFLVLTPFIYAGQFVFDAFASALVLKVLDRPLYRRMVLARDSDYAFTAAYAPRIIEVMICTRQFK